MSNQVIFVGREFVPKKLESDIIKSWKTGGDGVFDIVEKRVGSDGIIRSRIARADAVTTDVAEIVMVRYSKELEEYLQEQKQEFIMMRWTVMYKSPSIRGWEYDVCEKH